MLFPYIYVPHSMEKMQGFIDFIFFEVWCKAPIGEKFHPKLFATNPDLKEVMSAFGFSRKAPARGMAFYKDTKRIYGLFEPLSPADIKQLKKWYWGNNDLKKVCANNPAAHLVHYADIAAHHPSLSIQLAIFFKDIYSDDLLNLAALKGKIGNIDDHYQSFMVANDKGKCPFCGLNDLLGEYHSKREAYDHYLPKAFYPFNTINFRNLVPACHHCNSSYKGSKDTAFTPKDPCRTQTRRKLFYPYASQPWHIELRVSLQQSARENLQPNDITLDFGPTELAEQIDTWKEVYGIEERFRAKLCSADARDWLEQMLTQQRWHDQSTGLKGRSTATYLEEVAEYAHERPWANANFLKHGFLQACAMAGVFPPWPPRPRATGGSNPQ